MRPLTRPVAALVLAGALLGAACAAGDEDQPPTATLSATEDVATSPSDGPTAAGPSPSTPAPTATTPTDDTTAAANAAALAFTAPNLDGGTVDGTEFAGGDVVLWMWAPW